MSGTKFVLHLLEESRAQRVLWLLIELKLDYKVVFYRRTPSYFAPSELKKIHPLGKSPILEVHTPGKKEPKVLAETGYIFQYLLENFNDKGVFDFTGENGDLCKYYFHYSEGSLQPFLVGYFVNKMSAKSSPYGLSFLVKAVTGKINSIFYYKNILSNLDYLELNLAKSKGDYFLDDRLSPADIMLSFPINQGVFSSKGIFDDGKLKQKYPNLNKWSQKIAANENFLKADEEYKKGMKSKI